VARGVDSRLQLLELSGGSGWIEPLGDLIWAKGDQEDEATANRGGNRVRQ
jgi:hypothetical protein